MARANLGMPFCCSRQTRTTITCFGIMMTYKGTMDNRYMAWVYFVLYTFISALLRRTQGLLAIES